MDKPRVKVVGSVIRARVLTAPGAYCTLTQQIAVLQYRIVGFSRHAPLAEAVFPAFHAGGLKARFLLPRCRFRSI